VIETCNPVLIIWCRCAFLDSGVDEQPIALANKLARIAWGVLARGRAFEASKLQAA
jgi:hypothetical protein